MGEMTVSAAPTITVSVTTTYLHLPSREAFRPAPYDDPDLLVMPAREPLVAFYRFLYAAVGRDYAWLDRLDWSDERLLAHLSRPSVTLLVLYVRGTPAGYIELDAALDDPKEQGTEVVYFGLIPHFHGRGLGKHLLSVGVAHAFAAGAERVWLHTCTLDGPHALANYRGRGFIPYKTTVHEEAIPVPQG
jgi:ribosomal protein S18 acetylase RimI-like enzyme